MSEIYKYSQQHPPRNEHRLTTNLPSHTKPEGYVELAELGSLACCDDGSMKDDNGVKQHIELQTKAFTSTGRPPATAESLRGRLKEAGFVDVQVFNFKHPLGPWPKESRLKHIGALNLLNAKTGFHAYGMQIFTRTLGMPKEEAEKLCTAAYESIRDKRNHVYTLLWVLYLPFCHDEGTLADFECCSHVAYGRKP